jgi:carboxyl-terminal processing protease
MKFKFIVLLFISLLSVNSYSIVATKSQDDYINQFKAVFDIVEKKYVQEPDKQKMLDGAINGMLKSLDPYSSLFVDDELEDFFKEFDGEFGGIGVEIYPDKTGLKIISPIDDLPAFKAGIKAGDVIVGVDDYDVSNEAYDKSVKRIRGQAGTKVKLTIYRAGAKDLLKFDVVREIVKIHPVKTLLDRDIAYIRIVSFNKNTFNSLQEAIDKLEKNTKTPIKGMILDLRNNPGGLLDQAIKVGSYFIDNGTIVSIKGRSAGYDRIFQAEKLPKKSLKPVMIVLINGGSASASEIVAASLQDHNRAIIMGTKSFGKGSVQEFIPINKRSAIKLTEAKFYSPKGTEIQSNGVNPDIIVEEQEVNYVKKEKSVMQQFLSNSKNQKNNNVAKDSDKQTESKNIAADPKSDLSDKRSTKYLEDYQYARAVDLIEALHVINKLKSK